MTAQVLDLLQLENIGIVSEAMQKLALVSVVVTLALSLLQCFLGYKLLRGWVTVIGCLVGFFLGVTIASRLGATDYVPLIAGIVTGILLSILAYRIYLAGVFLYCGSIAAMATGLIPYPEGRGWFIAGYVIAAAAFLVAGLLAVKFAKPVIIGISAISGASGAVQALQKLTPQIGENAQTAMLLFAALIAGGILVQWLMNRGK